MPPRLKTATLISPGRFFTWSISSPSVLTPSDGGTATAIGCSQTKPIETKSRTRSYG